VGEACERVVAAIKALNGNVAAASAALIRAAADLAHSPRPESVNYGFPALVGDTENRKGGA